jgi:hypothetical protein
LPKRGLVEEKLLPLGLLLPVVVVVVMVLILILVLYQAVLSES